MANFNAFYPTMSDTHAYVGNIEGRKAKDNKQFSYLQKGTGHMVYSSSWEPQRTNNFELIIEGLDTLVTADNDSGDIPKGYAKTSAETEAVSTSSDTSTNGILYPPNAAERIMLSVDSFTAPSIEIAQITTQYGNNSIKWAGKPEFPNSSIVVNDYIGIQVEKILAAWFRCAYDFTSEKIGLAKDYKKTGYLAEYDPKGGTARVWRLDGLWLASFNLGEWSQNGNEQRKVNATLVYDRVVPDYGLEDKDWVSKTTLETNYSPNQAVHTGKVNPFNY